MGLNPGSRAGSVWSLPPPGRGWRLGGLALGLLCPPAVRKDLWDSWHFYVHYMIFSFPRVSEVGILAKQGSERVTCEDEPPTPRFLERASQSPSPSSPTPAPHGPGQGGEGCRPPIRARRGAPVRREGGSAEAAAEPQAPGSGGRSWLFPQEVEAPLKGSDLLARHPMSWLPAAGAGAEQVAGGCLGRLLAHLAVGCQG